MVIAINSAVAWIFVAFVATSRPLAKLAFTSRFPVMILYLPYSDRTKEIILRCVVFYARCCCLYYAGCSQNESKNKDNVGISHNLELVRIVSMLLLLIVFKDE